MPVAYKVVKIAGLKGSIKRSIVFLDGDGCQAISELKGLTQNNERDVRNRFDYWVEGGKPHDNYFHGWPNLLAYKDCIEFRWKEKKVRCRFYGFLCHPRKSDPSFHVCVLTGYDRKTTNDTDFTILDAAIRLKSHPDIKKLLEAEFSR